MSTRHRHRYGQPCPRWRWWLYLAASTGDLFAGSTGWTDDRPIRLAADYGLITGTEARWRLVAGDRAGLPARCYHWPHR